MMCLEVIREQFYREVKEDVECLHLAVSKKIKVTPYLPYTLVFSYTILEYF